MANSATKTSAEYLRDIVAAPVYRAARHTPLESMDSLSEKTGNRVLVKREDLQPVHSFKLRGAFNRMSQLTGCAGVITASAGNHAQGVALSGRELGIRSVIVMPVTTPSIKVDAVRGFGGEVVLHGGNFDAAQGKAKELSEAEGLVYVPPFDNEAVIAGQGTIGLEIFQAGPVDRVFVPVGGGGLAAGVAVLLKELNPEIQVIGVEPEESACLTAALWAGEPVELDRVSLFAEGVAVRKIGAETFRLCREYLDEVVTVSSDEVSAAIKDLFDDTRAIAEPAGAVSLAGLKKYAAANDIQDETLVNVLSGANLNFHTLRYISERAELGEGGEAIFAVTIPEQQGAFVEFCEVLNGRMVTEFNYRVGERGDDRRARIFVGVQLKEGVTEREAIADALAGAGYDVVDLSDDEIAKEHIRYMIGGVPPAFVDERMFSFEFPEHPGALVHFLDVLGTNWNITAFHYRSQGMDYGRILAAFEDARSADFEDHLSQLGYPFTEVTDNPSYQLFLAPAGE
ncbi:threonine ammonia-lyase, biosynthetic [Corynebacterium kalidii]|uniref:L-threonine dehydratase n=1 Tax=Corynebacterium kalidii TaxID=2931982 RepID=A0A9X2AZR2_9CORY|nr:threonine ammonia-lyase, biosynthetic [Corynebacterium kalidii]MCJ7859361.1 threonine ammonia-lyase, biosynthetic [Corynebacterium kalidii]